MLPISLFERREEGLSRGPFPSNLTPAAGPLPVMTIAMNLGPSPSLVHPTSLYMTKPLLYFMQYHCVVDILTIHVYPCGISAILKKFLHLLKIMLLYSIK